MKKYIKPAVWMLEAQAATVIATSIPTTDDSADPDYKDGGDTKAERQSIWDNEW